MTEEVRNKLSEFFEARLEETRTFYAVIRDYFSERLTDLQLPTFHEFEEVLRGKRLCNYIQMASCSNEYGSYLMDTDFYESHRTDYFLDSITDLGVIDFCTNALRDDMPKALILIRFPEVKVTNEHNRSVDIKELFVRLKVQGNRVYGRFQMIRTTYDVIQWLSRYSHSHIPSLRNSEVPLWSNPCLGSGPLNTTFDRLRHAYDEDFLGLFCLELSKYVTVESLSGVPYIRLESIGANNTSYILPKDYNGSIAFTNFPIEKFIKYFIENIPIKFSYVNGNYALGEPLLDFWIKMSNCFIDWYNNMYRQGEISSTLQELKNRSIIQSLVISEGKACTPISSSSISNMEHINHSDMFVFKGVMQKLNIEGADSFTQNQSILLSYKYCEYILTCILKLINCKYGRTNNEEGEAKVSKKCFYL